MESQIPCGIPRVLPLIGHGYHVGVVEMRPVVIPAVETLWRRRRLRWIALKPSADVIVVRLLAPQQSCKRLTLDLVRILAGAMADTLGVKIVRLFQPLLKDLIKGGPEKIPG